MVKDKTFASRAFNVLNYFILACLGLSCVLPFVNLLAISLSSSSATTANLVTFWPIDFQIACYKMVFASGAFMTAFGVSILRVVVGTSINLLFIIVTAYPLSKEANELKGRNAIMWFYIFPMMFGGGLIPFFLVVKQMGLIDSFWVLVVPGAVDVFSIIMMMNYFRGLNKNISESAMIDGAGHLRILASIFVPLSMPSIATLALFAMVGHWNDWFSGLIFLNDMRKWPLQTYLRQQLISLDLRLVKPEDLKELVKLSNRSLKAAQLIVATVPILCAYPFLQRYFVTGITLGSVKE
jgi:putative aldouronate transport system permease protein